MLLLEAIQVTAGTILRVQTCAEEMEEVMPPAYGNWLQSESLWSASVDIPNWKRLQRKLCTRTYLDYSLGIILLIPLIGNTVYNPYTENTVHKFGIACTFHIEFDSTFTLSKLEAILQLWHFAGPMSTVHKHCHFVWHL
jgi:hypothetical protein